MTRRRAMCTSEVAGGHSGTAAATADVHGKRGLRGGPRSMDSLGPEAAGRVKRIEIGSGKGRAAADAAGGRGRAGPRRDRRSQIDGRWTAAGDGAGSARGWLRPFRDLVYACRRTSRPRRPAPDHPRHRPSREHRHDLRVRLHEPSPPRRSASGGPARGVPTRGMPDVRTACAPRRPFVEALASGSRCQAAVGILESGPEGRVVIGSRQLRESGALVLRTSSAATIGRRRRVRRRLPRSATALCADAITGRRTWASDLSRVRDRRAHGTRVVLALTSNPEALRAAGVGPDGRPSRSTSSTRVPS